MNFKRNIPIFLLIILLFSCRKEEIILDDPQTNIDPPIEIEGAVYEGKVFDISEDLEGVEIDVYQNELLVGKIKTDENGFYSTKELLLDKGPEVTFAIEKENYLAKYKRSDSDQGFYPDHHLPIYPVELANIGTSAILENPGNSELVKVFGTITDIDGNPIPDVWCIVGYNFMQIDPNTVRVEAAYEYSDNNGYFEILVDGSNDLHFLGGDYGDQISCIDFINRDDETGAAFNLPFQYIGQITDDFEIIELPNLSTEEIAYSVTGTLLNCDGSTVSAGLGTAKVRYSQAGFSHSTNTFDVIFDNQGNFEIDFDLCSAQNISLEMRLENGDDLYVQDTIAITQTMVDLQELYACDDILIPLDPHYLELNVGDQHNFIFDNLAAASNSTLNRIFSLNIDPAVGMFSFSIDNLDFGETPFTEMRLVEFLSDKMDFHFVSENEEIVADIIEITNDKINGTFEGNVETEGLGIQRIWGSFSFSYQ